MSRFVNSLNKGLETGYGFANKADKNKASSQKNAYERYIEEHYGPGVTSHRDPLALARAAAGQVGSAVWGGVKTGAGALGHAAAGLLGAPQGPSRSSGEGAVSDGRGGIGSDASITGRNTPSNRQYGNAALTAGLSSPNNSGSGYGSFNDIGSRISSDLQRDFGLTANQAAGIVGNLGHESGGFRHYQEISPRGGGRGGAGWAQWTNTPGSPRRTAFENYTQQHNLHPQSYEANYGFLKNELTGTHAGALAAVKKANTIQDAVYAFEGKFERAGVKNYGSRMKYANSIAAGVPTTTLAYASTDPNLSPTQQAALGQSRGLSIGGRNPPDPQVAALQRDLNSRGAKLDVDGIRGPLTRQAEQDYYGSPTSVRTPSFTSTPTTSSNNWSSLQGSPTRTVNQQQDYVPTGSRTYTPQPSSYTSGRGDEGRGVPSPLSAQPRTVQAVDIAGSPMPLRPFQPAETARIPTARPNYIPGQSAYTSGRGDEGRIPAAGVQGPVPQTPRTPQPRPTLGWSQLQQPYPVQQAPVIAPAVTTAPLQWSSLQRPLPAQQAPVQQAVPAPAANWTLADIQQWADQHGIPVSKAAGVLSDIGGRMKDAAVQGMRSNMGAGQSYSGSGGNYSGGNYGGRGGSSINTGVGGAFRNR